MGISGSDLARVPARLAVARLGASRLGAIPCSVDSNGVYIWGETKPPTTRWTRAPECPSGLCPQHGYADHEAVITASASVLVPSVRKPGAVFWAGDEWAFKNTTNCYPDCPDTETYAFNIIRASLMSTAPSNIAFVDVYGTYSDLFKSDLEAAGHTVTRTITLGSGSAYDFVFGCLTEGGWTGATDDAKCQTMVSYIQAGGGLYMPLGMNLSESTKMAVLLSACGISYSETIVLGTTAQTNVNGAGSEWLTGVSQIGVSGAGTFTLGTPTIGGANARWTADRGSTAYYIFAVWYNC